MAQTDVERTAQDAQDAAYAAFSARRRQEIVERVEQAAAASGRDAASIDMLAVSKTVGVPEVQAALAAGWTHFAENRPQELVRKVEALGEAWPGTFDMIGHLQTNKINHIVDRVRLIHSIRSQELAEAVAKRALAKGIQAHVLLEINVVGEQSKSGMAPEAAKACLELCLALEGIQVEGLMAMAPAGDKNAARRSFSGLRELCERLRDSSGLELPVLSCGMSDDFEIAIEEGSTCVRLGRVAFDPAYQLDR